MKMKILFYISSLIPLSLLIFLRTLDYKNLWGFIQDNWMLLCLYLLVPIVAFIVLIVIVRFRGQIDQRNPKCFTNIQSQSVNFFTPISIYFIPFISSNFISPNDWFVAIFIITFVGLIVIKTDLQYLNPLILILGFHLYKASVGEKEVFILSRERELPREVKKKFNIITDNLYKVKGQ